MKRFSILMALSILLTAAAASSQAQSYSGGYGRGGGSGMGRASTPAEAAAFGMSAVIRSQGQYKLMTAQAAIAAQEAEKQYLQNRLAATQTYFEVRQMNKQYHDQDRAKPMSSEALTHYYEHMKPKRVSPSQLDPVSGQITWPLPLQGNDYASYREQLDDLYKQRAQHHEFNYNDVRLAAEGMQAEFKKHINEFAPQDFQNAYKLLDALAAEAHYPVE